MKQLKKAWYTVSTLLLVLPLLTSVLGTTTVFAEENGESTQLAIHKKKMTNLPDPLIQNSGKGVSEFDKYQGLTDVMFNIYNMTNGSYEQQVTGTSVDVAKQTIQGLTPGKPVTQGTTDANGNIIVQLPKKQNSKDAVYTIKEEPKEGVVAATNMMIAFPVYEMIKQADGSYKYGTGELAVIRIYPKGMVANDGNLHVKKVGVAENEGLNGAEFVVSKSEGSPGTVKYTQRVKDELCTWTTSKEQTKCFITGKSYEIGKNNFTGVENGTEELAVRNPEVGSYISEGVEAPSGAELIENQTKTPFTVKVNNQTPVEKTVKNDISKVDKTTPNLDGKDVAIGEKIKYQISVNILLGITDKGSDANKYVRFNLVDKRSTTLTSDNVTSGEYAYALYDGDIVIAPEDYQMAEQANDFTVAINPEYIPMLTPGDTLKFIYFMHLNEKADPTKGFKSEANADSGHTDDQTPPTAEAVTGGKRFIKVDDDVTAIQALVGVSFVVRNQGSDTVNYLRIDETTKAVTWMRTKAEATTFTTTAGGLVDITGLKYGTCYLEGTVAPGGYVLLTNRIEFVVNEQSYGTTENLVSPEKVPDKHRDTLPSAGDKGVCVYLGGGAVLLLVVGVYLARCRKGNT